MTDLEPIELAMFPLEAAFLPNQDLPLRIFEPRYVALVRHCVEGGEPFGVVLIARGREVGVLCRITECVDQGADRYSLRCRTGERIRVCEWLTDDPYPRASVRLWPDEPDAPGDAVTVSQLVDVEDRMMDLFERIAEARGAALPDRDVLLGSGEADAGQRLFELASRIPIGAADRYAVLSAPSAAERLAALGEAVDAIAEMVEFQLSE
jgi:Lon protease-like protein